jgi:four helix bundle protein
LKNIQKTEDKEWKNKFRERLLNFSVEIIKLTSKLPKNSAGFAISSQLIKSATSIGANVEEAQDASSRKDFVQKLTIALRESRETKYWLTLIEMSDMITKDAFNNSSKECSEIIAILSSSVKSSKAKL